ncbi:MAG: alpha/beta hydrolase [Pseudomonadota bacterium]|nr:alpha/beta hydrolase [Pseudomonadota bacterium]
MGAALSDQQFIEVEGAALRVRSAGQGPAIVLIHGWALDLEMWRDQIELLSPRYRVIAFDRRGFGLSSGEPDIEQDVLDIDRVLARFEIERAAVVGMSQGARVALRWALKHPERAACLVLDGPPADGMSPPPGGDEIPLEDYRERARRDGIDAFKRQWLLHPFMQLQTKASGAQQLLREMAIRYPARDLLLEQRPPHSPLRGCDLQRLLVPTLILSGEYDSQQRRSIARQLTQALPNARLKTVVGAGHLAVLDDPGTYSAILRDFISSQRALAAGAVI